MPGASDLVVSMAMGGEGAIGEVAGGAVLAVLDDDGLGAELHDLLRGAEAVGFVGKHAGLAVVDEEDVEFLENLFEVVGVVGDPVVHSVAADHFDVRQGFADLELEDGVDVGEEEELGILEGRGDLG